MKICYTCKKHFSGRSDAIFCSDVCRTRYHNHKKSKTNDMIEKNIDEIMRAISEISQKTKKDFPNKLEKLTQDAEQILAKELHLCVLRYTYRMDEIRHNYDNLEELL